MAITGILSTAQNGLLASARQVGDAAHRIVNADPRVVADATASLSGTGKIAPSRSVTEVRAALSDVDLVGEFSRMIQAETAYRASAAVFRTGEEMVRAATDTFG